MRWEYLTQSVPAETPAETLHRQLNELWTVPLILQHSGGQDIRHATAEENALE
jgi:hypothetical protein